MDFTRDRLGELLLREGVIAENQLFDALEKVADGLTSLDEIARVVL